MKKIGLIINPIAGMGGRVGLKGTDGLDVLKEALERGAEPEAGSKAKLALEELLSLKDSLTWYVGSGPIGEDLVKSLDYTYHCIYEAHNPSRTEDTLELARRLVEEEVDLILFTGGDGTARDLVKAVGVKVPVIGIPAGVKIHSPVYARTPRAAGQLAREFLSMDHAPVEELEVIDIEEEAFRRDEIITGVYGYLLVPEDTSFLQNTKSPSPQSEQGAQTSAALTVIDEMEDDVYYIIGSGSTTSRIMTELGLPVTMLGVDIIKNKQLVAKDVYEDQIIDIIKDQPTKLIVTPMGGQGYLFGRGNQQLSYKVLQHINKEDITILSTSNKLQALQRRPLIVYTGDPEVDQKISGYYRIVVGYGRYATYKVEAAEVE